MNLTRKSGFLESETESGSQTDPWTRFSGFQNWIVWNVRYKRVYVFQRRSKPRPPKSDSDDFLARRCEIANSDDPMSWIASLSTLRETPLKANYQGKEPSRLKTQTSTPYYSMWDSNTPYYLSPPLLRADGRTLWLFTRPFRSAHP